MPLNSLSKCQLNFPHGKNENRKWEIESSVGKAVKRKVCYVVAIHDEAVDTESTRGTLLQDASYNGGSGYKRTKGPISAR